MKIERTIDFKAKYFEFETHDVVEGLGPPIFDKKNGSTINTQRFVVNNNEFQQNSFVWTVKKKKLSFIKIIDRLISPFI